MEIAEIRERLESDPTFRAITDSKKRSFVIAYALSGRIATSAHKAGVTDRTILNWKNSDPRFTQCVEHAHRLWGEYLEATAEKRATQGLRQYKFDKKGIPLEHPVNGGPYYEDKMSDVLLIFLLKGAFPEKYKERWQVDVPKPDNDIERARQVLDQAGSDPETLAALNILAKQVAASDNKRKQITSESRKVGENGNGNGKASEG